MIAVRFVLASCLFFLLSFTASARDYDLLADLDIEIRSDTDTAINGEWLNFTVKAWNKGPEPIFAVDNCEIQFSPANGQYGDDGAGGGDATDAVISGPGSIHLDPGNPWTILWFPGALAAGAAVEMDVSVPLHIRDDEPLHAAIATGGYSNSSNAETNDCDPDLSNNVDELLLDYVPARDLSLSISDPGIESWDLASDEGWYELILTVSNAGPSVARGAVVTNELPPGCSYSIEWPPSEYIDLQGNVLTWFIGDANESGSTSLYPGVTADLVLWITPTNAGEKVTTCRLYDAEDTNPTNNFAEHSLPVTGSSSGGETNENGIITSLQLMGWDVVPVVERFGTIQYALRVKNNMETNDIDGVVVTNILDARCLFESASTPQGAATNIGQTVVFDLGTVTAGSDFILDLFVTPLESGIMTNDARIYSLAANNEYGDSAVIEETTVNPGPDLCTVTPLYSITPTYGARAFQALVQTNGEPVSGVTVYSRITRGPHIGEVSNAVTAVPGPGIPAHAFFLLEDEAGYPGLDQISITGMVGRLPFSVPVQAEWQLMDSLTYSCTNLGYIIDNGISQFEINVPDGFEIADLRTGLHLEHTYPGDLEFRLYSPADFGEPVVEAYLIEELPAFGIDDLEIGRSNAFCVLDESAAASISTAVPPFSGSYQSQNLEMTNFVGVEAEGTWVLHIEDMNLVDVDGGELLGWTLILDPADGDLDNDGMNDQWEMDNGLDPNNPNDGILDGDHDGVINRNEFRTRTSPTNSTDGFGFSSSTHPNGDEWIIRWSSQSNQFYSIRWTSDLIDGFTLLESGIPATPPENEYVVTNLLPHDAFFEVSQEY